MEIWNFLELDILSISFLDAELSIFAHSNFEKQLHLVTGQMGKF